MPIVLFAGRPELRAEWRDPLIDAAKAAGIDIDFQFDPAEVAPEAVDYLLYAPSGPIKDLRPYGGMKAILSLWAGVETVLPRPDLPPEVPVVRMVEPGLTEGMSDYVIAHTMRYHIDLDGTLARHKAGRWDDVHPPLARDRVVGVMGLGALGADATSKLTALGFQVVGWSRTRKALPNVICYADLPELDAFLGKAHILIILVPETPDTIGLLDERRLRETPKGACVVNAARGTIFDDDGLLRALDDHLGGATLDVFREEPLPPDHRFWRHPKVTVTPHVASVTRPETAADAVVAQIVRGEAGLSFEHVADRARGY